MFRRYEGFKKSIFKVIKDELSVFKRNLSPKSENIDVLGEFRALSEARSNCNKRVIFSTFWVKVES